MASFTDQMKALTDEISNTKNTMFSAVASIKGQTEQILGNAQSFMNRLSDEHRTMAAESKSDLAADRRSRSKQVRTFRASTRRQQGEARHELQEKLRRNTAERLRSMNHLRSGFQEAQQALANDLREAGRVWRQLVSGQPAGQGTAAATAKSQPAGGKGRKAAKG